MTTTTATPTGGARTEAELLALASRFTLDRNAVAPGDRAWRPDLVLHVERYRTGRWWIRQIGSGGEIYHIDRGEFVNDRACRTAEDHERDAYLLDRDEALDLAHALPVAVLTGLKTAWRWQRRATDQQHTEPTWNPERTSPASEGELRQR